MDRQFLEFWGNYLLAAAKGQKQLEDLSQWMRRGFSGFEELTAMFKKYYGLQDPRPENPDAAQAWQKAAVEFRSAFDAYLNLMGLVPKDKYQALEQKCAALQKKVAEQAETIQVLRRLLAEEGTYQGETVKVFQELANKQVTAFETFMKNLTTGSADEQ